MFFSLLAKLPFELPLRKYRTISLICLGFLFPAFVLYLLVAVSLPIWKGIYLVRVYAITDVPATSIATELRFGVWGVCASSAVNPPNWYDNPGRCVGPMLGYTIPDNIAELVGISPDIVEIVTTGLLVVLILHPIVAGMSFATLVLAIFLRTRTMAILSLVLSIITSSLASIVFLIDLVIALTLRAQIGEFTNDGFAARTGNAVWMILAAVILSWGSVVALSARACYCCGVRSKDRATPRVEDKY